MFLEGAVAWDLPVMPLQSSADATKECVDILGWGTALFAYIQGDMANNNDNDSDSDSDNDNIMTMTMTMTVIMIMIMIMIVI